MSRSNTIEILFFGDLVGKPGRVAVKNYLAQLHHQPDFVIANVENSTHGFGLGQKHYLELLEAGIHVLTSGNHIWDRKEIFEFIHSADALLRPYNFQAGTPGVGAKIFERNGYKLGVLNLIGQVFMGNYNSPWESLDEVVPELKEITPVVFLDFHAEATAEKRSMAYYASSLGVSAMVGTHTHVQTADLQIMNNRMGYITDAGFNGVYDSVIGMDPQSSLQRSRSGLPTRLDVAEEGMLQINAVRFWVDARTGICVDVQRINEMFEPSYLALQK